MNKKGTEDFRTTKKEGKIEVRLQESPVERALKLSSNQVIAMAIKDLIKRDDLN